MTKPSRLQSALRLLLRPTITPARHSISTPTFLSTPPVRHAHREASKPPVIPTPIPFVPDVKTFLTVIGRNLSQHTAKFPTWEALFSLTSPQLKELGIEPPRTRRYLVLWRDKYRQGAFGPGGDLKYVDGEGRAKLTIEETEAAPLDVWKRVVNIPMEKQLAEVPLEERVKPEGYRVEGQTVAGPYAIPMKGENAVVVAPTEGMWELKRGRKIDGGERRRAMVRHKRRIAENKAAREAMGL